MLGFDSSVQVFQGTVLVLKCSVPFNERCNQLDESVKFASQGSVLVLKRTMRLSLQTDILAIIHLLRTKIFYFSVESVVVDLDGSVFALKSQILIEESFGLGLKGSVGIVAG